MNSTSEDINSPIDWLNDCLKDCEEAAIEQKLSGVSLKLHVQSQEITDALELEMKEFVHNLPKALHHVQMMDEEIAKIRSQLDSINNSQILLSNKGNFKEIDSLNQYDIARTNMSKCITALSEHTKWNQIVRETTLFLENGGKLGEVANRLEAMFNSLSILSSLPGHEERQTEFKDIREAVFSNLRPRVQHDVMNNDLVSLQEYFHIYERLGRRDELEEEYVKLRAKCLQSLWDSYPRASAVPATGASPVRGAVAIVTANYLQNILSWLDKLGVALKDVLQRAKIDIDSLFGQARDSSSSATTDSNDRLVTLFCRLVVISCEQFTSLLLNDFKLLPSSAQPSVICSAVFDRVNDIVSTNIWPFIEHAPVVMSSKCLSVFFEPFIAFSADYFRVEEANVRHFLLENVLRNVRFDVIVQKNSSYEGGLMLDLKKVDTGEIMCEWNEMFASACGSPFSETFAQLWYRNSNFVSGLYTKQTFRIYNECLKMFTSHYCKYIGDLAAACGVKEVVYEVAGDNLKRNSAVVGAGSGDNSKMYAEKLFSALFDQQNLSLENSHVSNSLLALGGDAGSIIFVPSVLKCLKAVGSLSRTVLMLKKQVVNGLRSIAEQLDAENPSVVLLYAQNCYLEQYQGFQEYLQGAADIEIFVANEIFLGALSDIERMKIMIGSLIIELLSRVSAKSFTDFRNEAVWRLESSRVKVDQIMPQAAFTQFGDEIFSVVQQLEAFVGSDSSECIRDIAFIRSEDLCGKLPILSWRNIAKIPPVVPLQEDIGQQHGWSDLYWCVSSLSVIKAMEDCLFGKVITTISTDECMVELKSQELCSKYMSGVKPEEQTVLLPEEDDYSVGFVNIWLITVYSNIVGTVLSEVFAVPKFTKHGLHQLNADLLYLSNIARTLGIHPHPIIVHLSTVIARITEDPASFINDDLIGNIATMMTSASNKGLSLWAMLMTNFFIAVSRGCGVELKIHSHAGSSTWKDV